MNRSFQIFYLFFTIALGFLGGILLLRFTPDGQAKAIIALLDSRIFLIEKPSIWKSILPLIVPYIMVVLLAFHSLLRHLVRAVVALRAAFFGFSSGYLIQAQNSFWEYAFWWFPFQLLYCISLILFCVLLVPNPFFDSKIRLPIEKILIAILVVNVVLFGLEVVMIEMIFKMKQ